MENVDSVYVVNIDRIQPNPHQPRKEFDEESLRSLARSIRDYGILQPLVVTAKEVPTAEGFATAYELIAGERRLRAARLASLTQVPVIVKKDNVNSQEKFELAIIENAQREDLNPIDRAEAFGKLVGEFNLTHSDIAIKIGKSREYVSNSIRLLSLPEDMKTALKEGVIMEGHARPLLMLIDRQVEQRQLFLTITTQHLTVRAAEKLARSIATDKARVKKNNTSPELVVLEETFSELLGTRVTISEQQDGIGTLSIDFFSPQDLEAIIQKMQQHTTDTPSNDTKKNDKDDLYSIDNFSL